MNPVFEPRYEWSDLPWKQIQAKVFKLQRRIYRASKRRRVRLVHKLQRLLVKSWYGRLLAVRRVTQDNQGKRTAGIDGVKNLTPTERLQLAHELSQFSRPRPLRRIWIPKPGKQQKRPISIPVMRDRANQALIKLALEPQWEAKLEPNVYGFRPGRSCQDAIKAIDRTILRQPKYVLKVDICGCFDNISHAAILRKSKTPIWMQRLLRGWLKCGVLDDGFHPTERGSPQGGVISPLLALIALHGLETHLNSLGTDRCRIYTVAYADDIVVLARREQDIYRARVALEAWLSKIGLQLHPQKTRICHTLDGEDAGFEFLGFQVQQYATGKYASKRGYKTLITPSKTSIQRHSAHLKQIIRVHRGASQSKLIGALNPVISGWCQYYRGVAFNKTFATLSSNLFFKLLRWAKRRHSNLNVHQVASRYWLVNRGEGWVFKASDGSVLRYHRYTRFHHHIKVQGKRSPYDGDWVYWGTRLKHYPGLSPLKAHLLHHQDGKCRHCGLNFMLYDSIEMYHLDGIRDNFCRENLALLHRHCLTQTLSAKIPSTPGTCDIKPSWRGAG